MDDFYDLDDELIDLDLYDVGSYLDPEDGFDYDDDSDYEKFRDRNWDLII